jgi:hypothetical protein
MPHPSSASDIILFLCGSHEGRQTDFRPHSFLDYRYLSSTQASSYASLMRIPTALFYKVLKLIYVI